MKDVDCSCVAGSQIVITVTKRKFPFWRTKIIQSSANFYDPTIVQSKIKFSNISSLLLKKKKKKEAEPDFPVMESAGIFN